MEKTKAKESLTPNCDKFGVHLMKSLFYLKVIMMKTGIGDLIHRTEKHDISFLNYSSIKIDLS